MIRSDGLLDVATTVSLVGSRVAANSNENYRLMPVDRSILTRYRNSFCTNDVSGKVFKELDLRGTIFSTFGGSSFP